MGSNLSSAEKQGKRKILEWAYKHFNTLKESTKVRIWEKIYDKSEPDVMELRGNVEHPVRVIFRAAPDLPEQKAR